MPAKAVAGTAAVLKAWSAGPLEGGAPAPPLVAFTRRNDRVDSGYPGPQRACRRHLAADHLPRAREAQ